MMQEDLRYVSPDEMKKAGGRDAWRQLFRRGGKYGDLLRGFETLIVVDGTLFAHTGYSPAHFGSAQELAAQMEQAKALDHWGDPAFGQFGPVWYRGLLTR